MSSVFEQRYDALLARWPVPFEVRQIPGRYARTQVLVAGGAGSPVVLLHGGRATSAAWYATVGELAERHRVYAVDWLGDRNRTVRRGEPAAGLSGLLAWLAETLDALGLDRFALVGHSFGAWIAARCAMDSPDRIERLILLDPSEVFGGSRPAFMARAVMPLVGRTPRSWERFLRWEAGGRALDREFVDLWTAPGDRETGSIPLPRHPGPAHLARLTMPVLVVAAGASRQNRPSRLVAGAEALPDGRALTLPDATHFTVPQQHPDTLNPALVAFLGGR